MPEDLQQFLSGAAAVWHLLVILAAIAAFMMWADRRSDRVWRAELHGRDLASRRGGRRG